MWCPLWCHHNGRHTAFGDIAAQMIIAHTTQDRFHCWLPGVHHRLRPIRPPSSGTYLTRSTTTARSVVCISIAGTPHWRMALASTGSNGTLASEEAGIGSIQEGMVNEPDSPSSWHRIHLTSQTLHSVGVGVYVSPGGTVYATEDMVS